MSGAEASLSEALMGEHILNGVVSACKESDTVRIKVASSLSHAGSWIVSTGLPQSSHNHKGCYDSKPCPAASSLSKYRLTFELTALHLNVLFSSPVPQSRAETILPNLLKMLEDLKRSVIASHTFPSTPTLKRKTLSTLLPATASVPGGSHDWRSTLLQALTNQAGQTHETIIDHMREVCHDLELRCENVEEPLRNVTAQLKALAAEHERTKSHCEALLKKNSQSAQMISELNGEKDRFRQRVESLASQLRAAQEEVQRTRKEAEYAVCKMDTRARDAELEYSATITAKDDLIDDLQLQVEDLKGEQEALQRQVAGLEKGRRSLTEQLETLSREKSEALALVNMLRDEVVSLQLSDEAKDQRSLEQDAMIKATRDENASLKGALSDHQLKVTLPLFGSKVIVLHGLTGSIAL